jgi:hypothetical protein
MPLGLYGPERLQYASGGDAAYTEVFVFLPGSVVKAVLYGDANGLTTGANPVWTDQNGELTFFAEVGDYDIAVNGAIARVSVTGGEGGGTVTPDDLARATHYHHSQTTPSDTWIINHTLGYPPGGIVVTESTGDIVSPRLIQNTASQTILSFDGASTGDADCS